ncbi:MAG: OsmC family protein, partial [Gemmatimonadota bacterium]
LGEQGHDPDEVTTDAECTIREVDGAPTITEVRLHVTGRVPGIDEATFREVAEAARDDCPVSRALAGNLEIHLEAELAG